MAEWAGVGFHQFPAVALPPEHGEFAALEPSVNAHRCIVGGDPVATEHPQELAAKKRPYTASRFDGSKHRCARRACAEQLGKLGFREVVEEEIGYDDIRRRVVGLGPVAHIANENLRTPAE